MYIQQSRWKPLDLDGFKVNYDRSIFSKQDIAGIGVVICNSKGAVMGSLL